MKRSNIGLLLLAVSVVGWFLAIRPQIKKFSENALQVSVKNIETTSYEQRVKDLDAIKSSPDFQATLDARYSAMPKSSQIPEVLVMIESIGSQAGVTFSSATIGSPNPSDVPVSLSFSGDLAAVQRFLDTMNNNVRTVIVKSQNYSSDSTGTITANLQVGLVYQGKGAK